jgi:F-type H+-transporting ATPase subunit beta
MQKYDSLKNIIAIVGENELSPADRADYQNAKKLIQFFSQDFAVAEKFSGKPGEYFTLEETLSGIEAIVESKPDEKSAEASDDAKDKIEKTAATTQPADDANNNKKPAEPADAKK